MAELGQRDETSPSSNRSDRHEVFVTRFNQLRRQFDEQRAKTAALELTNNRLRVQILLLPSRGFLAEEVCTNTATEVNIEEDKGTKLKLGNAVKIILDKKTSKQPRFREPYCIPKSLRIPNYTNWSFITESQQQRRIPIKKKLFYTDEAGESQPASDDDSETAPTSYYTWSGQDVEWREFCLQSMESDFNCDRNFPNLLSRYLGVDLSVVEARLEERKTSLQNANSTMEDTSRLLCRRCLQYNCLRHPQSNVMPVVQRRPSQRDPGRFPCGNDCWKMNPNSIPVEDAVLATKNDQQKTEPLLGLSRNLEGSSKVPSVDQDDPDGWTMDEVLLLEKGVDIYGDDPCLLGRFVWSKSCDQIYQYLTRYHGVGTKRMSTIRKRRKLSKKVTISRKGAPVIAKRLRHNETELWHQYLPCSCKNGCTSNCICIKSKNFCDKYCACWCGPKSIRKVCNNAWKGCKCGQRCDTQRCPCVAAARECDPDICGNCRCTLDSNYSEDFACKNMNIRMRRHKRVAMGLSEIIGWGTFMMEEAKKDDLVGEYIGELISDDEAERRGRIYDMEDKSYLFSATTETVIDANHRGNKLRFANHSAEPNCYVKYLLVDGDYRVGIFAGRDISAGEELLYDYGTSFLSNWNDDVEKTASFPAKTAGRRT